MMNVEVGDTVVYTATDGGERTVKITEIDEKNGMPVFSGDLIGSPGRYVWGYFHQIDYFVL